MTQTAPRKRRKKKTNQNRPMPDKKQRNAYGKQVRDRREALGMSMATLATEIGVSYAAISNIERGDSSPSIEVYRRICDVLKVGVPPLME